MAPSKLPAKKPTAKKAVAKTQAKKRTPAKKPVPKPTPRKRAPKAVATRPATPGEIALAAIRQREPRWARFVEQLMIHNRGADAYLEAGFEVSRRTAHANGHRLRYHPDVAPVIALLRAEIGARTLVTAERVIEEMARIAFSDPRNAMSWGPDGVVLEDSEELDDDTAAAVAEVSHRDTKFGRNVGLKMHDKLSALKALGEHLELWKNSDAAAGALAGVTINVSGGPTGLEVTVQAAAGAKVSR